MGIMVRGSETAKRLSYCLREDAPRKDRQSAENEIASALRRDGGDIAKASARLGVGRATLHRWVDASAFLQRELDTARKKGPH
jgi:transcriptional regulator of acetoin/glycerol metabolism